MTVLKTLSAVQARQTGAQASDSSADRVVWLKGEHDVSTVPELVQLFSRTISLDHADLVVDLSEVEFMDASTVGVMIRAREFLADHSRQLVVRGPSATARRILDLCGLSELIGPDPQLIGERDGARQ